MMAMIQVRMLAWCLRWRRSFSTAAGSVQLASCYRHLRQLSQIVQFLRNAALHFLDHLAEIYDFLSLSRRVDLRVHRTAGRESVYRPFQLVLAVVVHQLMNIKITQTQIVHNSVCARGYKLPAFGSCRENVTSFPQSPAPPSPGFMLGELVSPEKYINFPDFYFRRASSSRW